MKNLLRSALVLTASLSLAVVATLGYFTSNVSATGNLITTGTLRLALDSTLPGSGNAGYVVAYDNNGVMTQLANFPAITNVAPGDTRSVYVAVRNIGSLAFDYRANITGTWSNPTLDGSSPNDTYLTVTAGRMDQVACTADPECNDIQGWLTGFGFSIVGSSTTPMIADNAHNTAFFGHPNLLSDGSYTLIQNQYSVFKLDFTLSTAAGNDFQGQTFTWALNAQSKQTTAPSF